MSIEHEKPANDNIELHRNPDGSGRWTNLVNEKGEKIPGATAELELVNGPEQIMPQEIDVEGKQDISDIKDTKIGEARSPREQVKEKIKIIFRNLDASVYRSGGINEVALGHRIDFEQGPRDFTYIIPFANAEHVRKAFDEAVKTTATDTGFKFAAMSIDNKLEPAGLGFTRTLELEGEKYRVNFLYAHDQTEAANDNEELEAAA